VPRNPEHLGWFFSILLRMTPWGAYETLDYLKEAPAVIRQVLPRARAGALAYNSAEPQSVLALEVIRKACSAQGLRLGMTPVSSTADAVMAAQAQVSKGVQAFFTMPDNTVFGSLEGHK
jgi:putative ABC transport system substrate-binding protein